MRRLTRSAAVLISALALVMGCEGSTEPDMASVAGSYQATTLTTTTGGVTTNELSAGAVITLVLNASGTTTGQLLIPEGNEDGSDFLASLAGTWTLDGNTVQLSHSADTFLNDMPLTVSGNALVGDRTFAGTRVQLTLTRQ